MLCTTQWTLAAASDNLNWEGLDLRGLIHSREEKRS
jgi:hypothetical protein